MPNSNGGKGGSASLTNPLVAESIDPGIDPFAYLRTHTLEWEHLINGPKGTVSEAVGSVKNIPSRYRKSVNVWDTWHCNKLHL